MKARKLVICMGIGYGLLVNLTDGSFLEKLLTTVLGSIVISVGCNLVRIMIEESE